MNEILINTKGVAVTSKPDLVSRLYILSLIAEPLLYFTIASGGQNTGVPLSLSRILQVFVLICLFGRIIRFKASKIKSMLAHITIDRYLLIHILILLMSSVLGVILFGSYKINISENFNTTEGKAPFLKSEYMRPMFDLFLLLYYYFYFVILAPYFLKTNEAIRYFFRIFIHVLFFVLIAGFIDLATSLFTGEALIKRHLGESTDVGFRFHSIAGEPRDAFVYLIYSFCVVLLYTYFFIKLRNKKLILIMLISAIILTQSASGILGLLMGGVITLVYFLRRKNLRALHFLFLFLILSVVTVYLIALSPRLQLYVEGFSELYDQLKSGGELPYVLMVQSVNFLPFWGMYNYLLNFNFYQLFFGSGLSSVAYYNINYIGDYSYSNPNAQITRVLFDGGGIGFYYYFLFLTAKPIYFFTKLVGKINYTGLVFFFILTGVALSHRSLLPFIFLGIINAIVMSSGNEFRNVSLKTQY